MPFSSKIPINFKRPLSSSKANEKLMNLLLPLSHSLVIPLLISSYLPSIPPKLKPFSLESQKCSLPSQ